MGAPWLALFAATAPVPRWLLWGLLQIMWCLGLFHLARYLTRDGLRIICYHGFALAEEHKYRSSKLFIRDDLFRRRIVYLRRHGYPILPLGEAAEALSTGRLPPRAIVITMDDRGVYTVALPIIKERGIPVIMYIASYYVENPMPVYTVTCSHLFWRTKLRGVVLPRWLDLNAAAPLRIEQPANRTQASHLLKPNRRANPSLRLGAERAPQPPSPLRSISRL